jgi:4-amino-4-deoxy-L-arabinose transferase-like glycosyltransferase
VAEKRNRRGRLTGRPFSLWAVPVALVVLALVIRVGAVAMDGNYLPRHDSFDYDRHARSIAAGDGFPQSGYVPDGGPSALRAPGYPYALGLVYAVSGDSIAAGRIFGAALGALTVLLLFLLARRIWGRRIALFAAALAAVFPPLVALSTELFSENLFIPILLGAVLCVLRYRESAALRWAVAAGALAGMAALTRGPGIIALLPLLFGLWFLRPRLTGRALAGPAIALACSVAVVAPWTIRNAIEFGRFIPITTSTGFGLAGTYNDVSESGDTATAAWRTPIIVPEYEPLFTTPGVDEGTLDSTLRDEATGFMSDHPVYVATAVGMNLLRLTYIEGDAVVAYGEEVRQTGIGNDGSTADAIGLAVASLLAIVGLVAMRRPSGGASGVKGGTIRDVPKGPTFIWLIPVALILVAAPVAGLPRYRVPADPFLLILSALGLSALLRRLRGGRAKAALGAAFSSLALVALGGCGEGDSGGNATASGQGDGAPDPAYIKRADAICATALADARKLVQKDFTNSTAGDQGPLALATKALIAPGIVIRNQEERRLRALPPPAANADLDDFLGLFGPLGALSRQRLAAGRADDSEEAAHIETQLRYLAIEQEAAARAYGFDECSQDVIGEAFR